MRPLLLVVVDSSCSNAILSIRLTLSTEAIKRIDAPTVAGSRGQFMF